MKPPNKPIERPALRLRQAMRHWVGSRSLLQRHLRAAAHRKRCYVSVEGPRKRACGAEPSAMKDWAGTTVSRGADASNSALSAVRDLSIRGVV